MVHRLYTGLVDAKGAFAGLKPMRERLIALQEKCRPFGSDYLILDAVKKALDTAAYHFTREPDFYAAKPEQSPRRPPGN
jgi:hypothetical protein